ncbi:hypothetical protein ACMZ70_05800 [Gardnerella vaginalis]|uniref:hypothetical protein n=1 Tax=Gardnerella vaginalis TaxID=2702 RepID=UPI0039EE97AD
MNNEVEIIANKTINNSTNTTSKYTCKTTNKRTNKITDKSTIKPIAKNLKSTSKSRNYDSNKYSTTKDIAQETKIILENYDNKNQHIDISKNLPTLLDTTHLPGPLCMKKLSKFGAFERLSIRSGFAHSTAKTIEGRCKILKKLIPRDSAACMFTASWIWLGGTIPNILDVISGSHYRVVPHDHPLRVFRRKLLKREQKVIKDLRITSPARTICDIALTPSKNIYDEIRKKDTIFNLIQEYETSFKECEKIINSNPHFPGAQKAKDWLKNVIEQEDIFYEY